MKLDEVRKRATPGPWAFYDGGSGAPVWITSAAVGDGDIADLYHMPKSGDPIFRKENCEANAALIAHCVNGHDGLVALLKQASDKLYEYEKSSFVQKLELAIADAEEVEIP